MHPSTPPDRSRLSPWVLGAAAATTVVLLLVATRYGYHRDELYFLAAAERPAWGYVDQPPFTVAVAWAMDGLFPNSLLALRAPSAVAAGAVVLLTGLITRQLGGKGFAQGLAAFAIAGSGLLLAIGHLLATATFDLLVWALVLWLVVRLLAGADQRGWLVVGALAGVGLLNKHTMGFLLLALLVGILLTRARRLLLAPWPWAGAAIAFVVWLPNLVWQIANDWPTLEMLGSLQERHSGPGAVAELLALQPPLLSFVGFGIAMIGLWKLLRDPALAPWRPIGLAFVFLAVLFIVVGGRAYYFSALYSVLLGAGSVWTEAKMQRRSSRRNLGIAVAAGSLIAIPIALPVLPVDQIGVVNGINKELGETVGWPELVQAAAAAYQTIPPEGRAGTVLFTANYGVAGALDRFGPDLGLPAASSGHNEYWHWGPPDGAGPVVLVGISESYARTLCAAPRAGGTIDNGQGVENDEQGNPIWVCDRPLRPWADAWPDLRHYN